MAQQQSFLSESPTPAQVAHPKLQTYLDALEKPLAPLGAGPSVDWRREAEAHLHALVVANLELGSTDEEAVAAALQQFGNVRQVGAQVAREIRKQQSKTLYGFTTALQMIVLSLGLLGPVYIAKLGIVYDSDGSSFVHEMARSGAGLFLLCTPIVAGWNFGALNRTQKSSSLAGLNVWWGGIALAGFGSGAVYSTMFDLHLGSAAFASMPALAGFVAYPLLAAIGARLERDLAETWRKFAHA